MPFVWQGGKEAQGRDDDALCGEAPAQDIDRAAARGPAFECRVKVELLERAFEKNKRKCTFSFSFFRRLPGFDLVHGSGA